MNLRRAPKVLSVVALAVLALSACSEETATERLENMSEEEFMELSAEERMDLINEAWAESPEANEDIDPLDYSDEAIYGEEEQPPPTIALGETHSFDGLDVTVTLDSHTDRDVTPSLFTEVRMELTNTSDEMLLLDHEQLELRAGETGEEVDSYATTASETLDARMQPGASVTTINHFEHLSEGTPYVTLEVGLGISETWELPYMFTVDIGEISYDED